MQSIRNSNFKDKKVLVRVDFNVPLNDRLEVTDATRIDAALPTIKALLDKGASVVLMSHLGRPKGQHIPEMSLKPVAEELKKRLPKVSFINQTVGPEVEERVGDLASGEVLLIENLRFYKEETEGDKEFASNLARLGDFYVNDAFGTAHRAHASTAVIVDYFKGKCAFGLLMEAEIENVKRVLDHPARPNTAIVGGAKVSSKIDIIKNLINRVDNIIIGGGMAYTFILARGGQVGASLVEKDKLELANEILQLAENKGVRIALPTDSLNASSFSNEADTEVTPIEKISEGYMGLDIGPESVTSFAEVLKQSKTILWNGPLGVFEMENFSEGTKAVGKAIVSATASGAFSLVGGGDSVAAAKKFGLADQLSYVSTGGGAMLEFLEGKDLPGIKAIVDSNRD